MNIEQAKKIPLSVILSKLDRVPQRENDHEAWYFSPFRGETTPSFKVNKKSNWWIDHGTGQGGDVIDLVRCHLENHGENSTCKDALRWTRNMTGFVPRIISVKDEDEPLQCGKKDPTLVFKKEIPIEQYGLLHYGESRGIPRTILKAYLQEVHFFNSQSGKTIKALSLKNEAKGYEARNPFFKGCIQKKAISFIRGKVPKPEGVNIFEGFMDFLSVITQRDGKPLDDDAIILNSLNCMDQATAYIRNYGYRYCYTWMDNDDPGKKATKSWVEFCKTEENLTHIHMNEKYQPYKDVNAHHMAKLEL